MNARSTRCLYWLAALALAALPASAWAELQLPLLFADGAVLQRDVPMRVWGWATPGARIQVRLDGAAATAVAAADGRWQAQLPAHAAGGPYVLEVQGDGAQRRLGDVLVGDVWLASGQSNMEWPLAQARDGAREVAAANDPQLRHFKVPKSWSPQPQRQLAGGEWKAATPQDAGAFSAVGYFFARELRRSTGVPIGIVDSSWGGSAIEAWMDAAALGMDAAQTEHSIAALQAKDAQTLAAVRQRIARWPAVADGAEQWRAADLDDSDWDRIAVDRNWEASGYDGMDGIAWYRTAFTLSAEEAEAGITLGVGQVDDSDITYVNGQPVGHTEQRWNLPRVYRVPAAALHAGVNRIAVQVTDLSGGGGLHGDDSERFVQLGDGTKRPLPEWKFRPAKVSVTLDDGRNQQPTLLYNRMIHPLQPFPLKGVIWYQGESNAYEGGALRYREQFATLIRSWREERAQPQLPFLWVQLANFQAGSDKGDLSPWAQLRESQSRTLALPATAQAVTIDIGTPGDIHPTNKQDVGHRLALAARHVAYGEQLVYSAPVFAQAEFGRHAVALRFDPMGSALAIRGGAAQLHGFSVAGADRRFHPAQARIDGDRVVVVESAEVAQPQAVRYAWSENPAEANLVNREQLPVSPFRTDTW
ncbi:beta galactosidase jelly roll domain-containing protein [Xanthomonas sp. CFBP 8703]|uniref:Beta galactosidase jelly roll domain-containing protein n=1 Tax=Xanthomonas bonasiae TaxID=2810351 RepID=A0ABS3B7Q5_9XANT|nr:sialate O-acetylesterase [Xanthomonas bonasiae]MBN6104633.1 beta galactosidase jelly roll domain-containing protein [Xanthomonas bonasiae]MBN6113160.1 beta galactosidase jelly roll domain-containing protein [Xanthomonas bonasiae]